jgi:hypothetical protein
MLCALTQDFPCFVIGILVTQFSSIINQVGGETCDSTEMQGRMSMI